jgi:hypothetical protein
MRVKDATWARQRALALEPPPGLPRNQAQSSSRGMIRGCQGGMSLGEGAGPEGAAARADEEDEASYWKIMVDAVRRPTRFGGSCHHVDLEIP